VRLTYDLNNSIAWSGQTWEYRAAAAETGQLHYRWSYSGLHAWYQASARVTAFVERGGVTIQSTELFNQGVHGAFGGSGISSFGLAAGDVYGFRIYGKNFDSNSILSGNLDIQTSPRIQPILTGTTGGNGWYTSDVDLSWALTDPAGGVIDADGCEPMSITSDTTVTGATYTCTASSLGGVASHTVSVKRDATAPTTTDNAPTGAVDGDVVVDLTAADEGSGVAATYYRVNGGVQQSGATVTFATYGTHSLTYWSVDQAGNSETPRTVLVQIDKYELAEATFEPDIVGPTNQNVTVAVAFPAYAAIKEISADGFAWVPYEAPIVATANRSVYARYEHEDGGWSGVSRYDVVNIDKEAPSTNGETIVDEATGYVNVEFHAADVGSGVAGTYFRIDGGDALEGSGTQLRAQGAHSIVYWSVDDAGNMEEGRVLSIEVQRLPIPADGRFHIGLLLPWLKQSTPERLDLNDDDVFDKLDVIVMLRAIGPAGLQPPS
jgi:hypothetical protein